MGYGKSSTFYNIPYMESGDYLVESEEAKIANKIGNLLYVATFGATNAILTDANYTLTQTSPTNYSLILSSTNSVSILPTIYATFISIINGYLGYKTGDITLKNLTSGHKWYVYACCCEEMITDASSVTVISSTSQYNDINHLLLATVDFTGSSPVLDYTTGKKLFANISQHSLTTMNPHGTSMTQANLNITSSLKIGSKDIKPYAIVDITLDGTNDTTITAEDTGIIPEFVTLMSGHSVITVEISNTNVVFSSNSAITTKAKIEGTLA